MGKTTERVKEAAVKFFEENGLEQAFSEYFGGAVVKSLITDGYNNFQELLEEAKDSAPEEVKELADQVAGKLDMTEVFFAQEVLNITREKIGAIMMPAAIFISVKEQLLEVFKNQDDENLKELLKGAMDEIVEDTASRFANIVAMVIEGLPMELAEEIAEHAGNATVIPIGVHLHCGEDPEEDDESEGCTCGCGGHCNCGEEHDCNCGGNCQCDDGCNCGNNTGK